ncbi:MAG TPA: OmpA family protein [Dongiaceae bacterium]|jgi:outer membrane protein OmpA-like peptidoglycan-associated protein|nr:OmpA family protein [Dongiaceae bacterium]
MQDTPIVDPAPPLPDAYLVLFAPDCVELDESAKHALDGLLGDYKVHRAELVYIDGYYDRSGTEEHADEMSKRMAQVVRNYLVARGIVAASIKLAWHGENDPMVLTEDGVAEAANRSVEIRFTAKRNPLRP